MLEHRSGVTPSKSSANLTIGFGLVQIPVSLYSGTDDGAKIRRSQFTTDGHAIGNRPYDKETDKDYTGAVVKKVVLGDSAVELTDEEIEVVTGGPVVGMATIETFVPLDTIGTTYVVTDVKQVRPQEIKRSGRRMPNPGADTAFVLLCQAMADAKVAGLVKIALRGPARYAAIVPDGRMLMLAFAEEVRSELPIPDVEIGESERALAAQLIAGVGTSTPVLHDDAGTKLMAYITQKAIGGETATLTAPVAEVSTTSSLADLLAAAVQALPTEARPAKRTRAKADKAEAA